MKERGEREREKEVEGKTETDHIPLDGATIKKNDNRTAKRSVMMVVVVVV